MLKLLKEIYGQNTSEEKTIPDIKKRQLVFGGAGLLTAFGLDSINQIINPKVVEAKEVITTRIKKFISESKNNPEMLSNVSITINTTSQELTVFNGSESIAVFPVGVARKGYRTPTSAEVAGEGNRTPFRIFYKIHNPRKNADGQYSNSETCDKNSPVGCDYLIFHINGKAEYAIHGTNQPELLDRPDRKLSMACIRLKQNYLDLLVQVVIEDKTEVTVVE